MDYSKFKTAKAIPEASSMIETFRAIGYTLDTAVADIIDNSISADAKNIWIDAQWKGKDTTISILDDGTGMNNESLINAMRPGSKNAKDIRPKKDLGRFGLGLKTASFSQTRKFTVISKAFDYSPIYWSWDLDFVKETGSWDLIQWIPNESDWLKKMEALKSGTMVVWWDIDRLIKDSEFDNEKDQSKFLKVIASTKYHLSMVFHRYLDEGLKIYFNNRLIESWDPFMLGSKGLQTRPETLFENKTIKIKGFVLPHRSKITTQDYDNGKGPKDSWTAHQGFYVYRNKRLLVAGDWLGLFKREVHYDLCRIRIDLPNSFDDEWQIDIKKSIARPPKKYLESINATTLDLRKKAVEVYRHKGQVLRRKYSTTEYVPVWQEKARHGKRFYKLNRSHPSLAGLFASAGELKNDLSRLIELIEETIPIPLITLQESEHKNPSGKPFEGANHEGLKVGIRKTFQNLIDEGFKPERAAAMVMSIDPYHNYPEYIEPLIEK